MARYKPIDRNPRLLPVVLGEQIQPGTFEFALDHLVDRELDLCALDARFRNDQTGASAYDPRVVRSNAPVTVESLMCCSAFNCRLMSNTLLALYPHKGISKEVTNSGLNSSIIPVNKRAMEERGVQTAQGLYT